MQYLVSEVFGKGSTVSGEAKVFETADEAVKYLYKINKDKKLFVGDAPLGRELLEQLLKQRLSTISVFTGTESEKKWTVSSF